MMPDFMYFTHFQLLRALFHDLTTTQHPRPTVQSVNNHELTRRSNYKYGKAWQRKTGSYTKKSLQF